MGAEYWTMEKKYTGKMAKMINMFIDTIRLGGGHYEAGSYLAYAGEGKYVWRVDLFRFGVVDYPVIIEYEVRFAMARDGVWVWMFTDTLKRLENVFEIFEEMVKRAVMEKVSE